MNGIHSWAEKTIGNSHEDRNTEGDLENAGDETVGILESLR